MLRWIGNSGVGNGPEGEMLSAVDGVGVGAVAARRRPGHLVRASMSAGTAASVGCAIRKPSPATGSSPATSRPRLGPANSTIPARSPVVQIGYNWQAAPNWLIGVEADGSWTSFKEELRRFKRVVCPTSRMTRSTGWRRCVAARATLAGETLFYATGGVAFANFNAGWFRIGGAARGQFDATVTGFVVGGGVERAFSRTLVGAGGIPPLRFRHEIARPARPAGPTPPRSARRVGGPPGHKLPPVSQDRLGI